ncbi:hypothetical protein [Tomitella gaofuii]|uniref:hypothetical protein n=1 Tax=Tomitella gaofuii TaxID=2760083 RepID=UPI0015FD4E58|nr:hypothetical protein [Tomitella gaofuii]
MDFRDLTEGIVSDTDATRAEEGLAWYRIGWYAAQVYKSAVDAGVPETVALELAKEVVKYPLTHN